MERELLKKTFRPDDGHLLARNSMRLTVGPPRGAAVRFLVLLSPLKNMVRGWLRTCQW